MKCSFCGQDIKSPNDERKINGKTVRCCDEPWCQEQMSDMIDNTPPEKKPQIGGK